MRDAMSLVWRVLLAWLALLAGFVLIPSIGMSGTIYVAMSIVERGGSERLGIIAVDETERVTGFQEKPKHPKSDLASMGVYVFSRRILLEMLEREPGVDFGSPALTRAGGPGCRRR